MTSTRYLSQGKDKLLIRTKAISLSPADWAVQKYGAIFETFSAIAGLDIAGEVVKVGAGTSGKFKVGDRVFVASEFAEKEYGAFQQYVLADAFTTAIIPSNISYDEAATLPCVLSTAYVGFHLAVPGGLGLDSCLTSPGEHNGQGIFVSGGSSSVGQTAIQVARLCGFSYIITTSSFKHVDFLKSLGATHVLDRNISVDELKSALSAIEGLPKIEYSFDAVGIPESLFKLALAAVTPGGKVVTVVPQVSYDPSAPKNEGKVVSKFTAMKRDPRNVLHLRQLWGDAITRLLEMGDVKGVRVHVLPGGLGGIVAGLKQLENNEVSGIKLVVHPDETA